MRTLLQTITGALLSADADAVVGAEWGQRSPQPPLAVTATATATRPALPRQRQPGAPADQIAGLTTGLNPAQAREKMRRLAGALSGWRDAARNNGVHMQEITTMAELIQSRLNAGLAAATPG